MILCCDQSIHLDLEIPSHLLGVLRVIKFDDWDIVLAIKLIIKIEERKN